MPSRRASFKNVAVEIILYVGLFSLVGHLTLNFWERYVIQSELSSMKTRLNSLKNTINGIENAYDNLHDELKVMEAKAEMKTITEELLNPNTIMGIGFNNRHNELKEIEAKPIMKPVAVSVDLRDLHRCKHKHVLDRSPQQDHQIQTEMKVNKTENFNWSESAGKNATTITKYPPKSIGVGSYVLNKQGQHSVTCRSNDYDRKCYNDYRNCRYGCNNWNRFGVY